jgi:CheY-like chemotaxis protein
MDLVMAELDGLETTRLLRAHAGTKDAIIVAVTARVFVADRVAAHRAGCDAFLSKPLDLTLLLEYLDGLLRTAHPTGARTRPRRTSGPHFSPSTKAWRARRE